MRPTRRGYGALVVIATSFLFAWGAGPRALNAVAGPVLVALLAGVVQVHRAGSPALERTEPTRGFPGETRTVTLSVDGGAIATITDDVDTALSGVATFDRSLPASVTYEITYEERGVSQLGPAVVRVRDVFGLVAARYTIAETTPVLVYPAVHAIDDSGSFLRTLGAEHDERTEFDRLREYVNGDRMRDIHWKTSAKHDDLLVTEFSDPTSDEGVAIAACATRGHVDEMATATATLCIAAMRAGRSVGLTAPNGSIPQGYSEGHRQRAFELLARTDAGDIPDEEWEAADLRVRADGSGVTVSSDDQSRTFAELTSSRENPLLSGVVS